MSTYRRYCSRIWAEKKKSGADREKELIEGQQKLKFCSAFHLRILQLIGKWLKTKRECPMIKQQEEDRKIEIVERGILQDEWHVKQK